jgi:hypothetical protein
MEVTTNAAGHPLNVGSSVDPAPCAGAMRAGTNPGEVSNILFSSIFVSFPFKCRPDQYLLSDNVY